MTQHLSPAQQTQMDNRGATGQWKAKTHGDVEDAADTLGLVNTDASDSSTDGDGTVRDLDPSAEGFESDLGEALPDDVAVSVSESDDGAQTYTLGEGEVTIHRTPATAIDLPGGAQHHFPAQFRVEDHVGQAAPRTVVSSHDDQRLNAHTAQRAVEHHRDVTAGRDPLAESQEALKFAGRDGLPTSYGFDLSRSGGEARSVAGEINAQFDLPNATRVEAYDSGGGNEVISVSGGDEGAEYQVMVTSPDAGSLDEHGWVVTAAYQDADGQWVEDDDELAMEPIEVPGGTHPGVVHDAVSRRFEQLKAKVAELRGR